MDPIMNFVVANAYNFALVLGARPRFKKYGTSRSRPFEFGKGTRRSCASVANRIARKRKKQSSCMTFQVK